MSALTGRPYAFDGPVGEQLRRRLCGATERADRLLGRSSEAPSGAEPERLGALIAALAARLAAEGGEPGPLVEEHAAALGRLRDRFEGRFGALAQASAALGELRAITSPQAMLARAPALLCAGSRLERVILSLVVNGAMIPEAACFRRDQTRAQQVLEQLRADPPRLDHPLIETELLRRRRATIVLDAQLQPRVDPRLRELMGWRSYVAAPIVVGPRVIGVVHADRGADRQLEMLDRDVLWEFVSGLAQAYESAGLRRTLRREREQMRGLLEWLGARSGQLTGAPITLTSTDRSAARPPRPSGRPAPLQGQDDRMVFEGLLTRRELDVLRLLAD
ncbi:MAG: GAF domain-containing protein, partial [Solirubrobacterales bacterium]|nr:GAF domain-containing protein [Solirubrobacterales bacterium]